MTQRWPLFGTLLMALLAVNSPARSLPLSPGDRLRLLIPADDALPQNSPFRLSGLYEVNLDGTLTVPFVGPLPAAGLETVQVERNLARTLIERGFFRPDQLQLSINVAQWAPVQVTVAGEIFQPGRVLINRLGDQVGFGAIPDDERNPTPRPAATTVAGDGAPERYLSAAIRQAGGLKPTADLRNIRLLRGQQEIRLDFSGIMTGQPILDIPLVAGDRIVVPETRLQPELVRPSQLTPSTIPVVLSNLTDPKSTNQAQITSLEYGTRLSQAVVAAGCAGGSRSTNAKRRAMLVRTERETGQTLVTERRIEQLLKQSRNDEDNPFLMPQDSVVCYDSTVTNVASVFRLIGRILSPFFLIERLFTNE